MTDPLLQASEYLAKGEKSQARALLDPLVFKDPGNWRAWLMLSEAVDSPYEIRDCLRCALKIAPDQLGAIKRLAEINALIRNEQKKAAEQQAAYQREVIEGYEGEYRPLTPDQVDAGLEVEKQPSKGCAWTLGGLLIGVFPAVIAYSVLSPQVSDEDRFLIATGVCLAVAVSVWLIAILKNILKTG